MLPTKNLIVKLCTVFAVLSALECASDGICNYNVEIELYLYNNGFHRNLSYGINFIDNGNDWEWLDKECTAAGALRLEQVLPAGAYASPDEVKIYYNDYLSTAIFKSPVNIELPEDSSSAVTIHFILRKIGNRIKFSIPIHGRYHKAISGGGTAVIEIPPPKLFLYCSDKKLHACEKSNKFCAKNKNREIETCLKIVTDPIAFHVPVGNIAHFYIVAVSTVIVILLGTISLLTTMHEYQVSPRKYLKKIKDLDK